MFKLSSDVLANFRGVQSALRELLDKIADIYRRLRSVEDRIDGIPSGSSITLPIGATDVNYDNSTSGLTATDVQDAIDELAASVSVVGAFFDGGGSAITAGSKVYVRVPFDCTIIEATALANVSGSAVVDVWKDTYANYPPTVADTITASAPVTISAATKSIDTTLTGWMTGITAGDVLAFNVDSCSTITKLNVQLKVERT